MVNSEALFIPERIRAQRAYAIRNNIAAIELVGSEKEGARLGAVMQLPSGSRVEVCGSGFNERTVKIRSNDHYYFVFWQDLAAVGA
jgi:hypothetical protein